MDVFGDLDYYPTHGRSLFEKKFKCCSMKKKSGLSGDTIQRMDNGGKILLPPTSLDILATLNIMYPMLFEISSLKNEKKTNCGVLEFTAEEGRVYIPQWMMEQIGLSDGDIINIRNTSLEKGSFVKFQPQSVNFLDISNPKAVLERELVNYTTLTEGDVISFAYNGKIYRLKVEELKPKKAVTIVEADIIVDFSPPVGYVEPQKASPPITEEECEPMQVDNKFTPFSGAGQSLRGSVGSPSSTTLTEPIPISRSSSGSLRYSTSPVIKSPSGTLSTSASRSSFNDSTFIPSPKSVSPMNTTPGKLLFSPPIISSMPEIKTKTEGFSSFSGKGNSLR